MQISYNSNQLQTQILQTNNKVKVKLKVNQSKMDQLINFKSYLNEVVEILTVEPKLVIYKCSYTNCDVKKTVCDTCGITIGRNKLICNNYDCANSLLLDFSKYLKLSLNEKISTSLVPVRVNPSFRIAESSNIFYECINHMIRSLKIHKNKNCAYCNRNIPYGLIVCRNMKCISQFFLDNCDKYKEFRVEYNKKYLKKKKEHEEELDILDEMDRCRYWDYEEDNRSDDYENGCRYCNEGQGGNLYQGCETCGCLSCGCIDKCKCDDDYDRYDSDRGF